MKIAIVGGGAAGLMAAATILEKSTKAEVCLLEKNAALGKKVLISGGGRCNVTTGIHDVRTVLTKYPRGGKFLSSAMYAFSPEAVYTWFQDHGVPLKTEDDLRVFPRSNRGSDIVGVFEHLFRNARIHVMLNTSVIRIENVGKQFHLFLKDRTEPLAADRVILTTGGQAYRQTGSTGDGYAFATSLGHTITKLAPSLNAFFTRDAWPARVSGLSFEKATLKASCGKTYSFTGPFLFTHKGVSGPAVFALSSLVAFESYDEQNPLKLCIDLFPDTTEEELAKNIEAHVALHTKKHISNILTALLPKSLVDVIASDLGLSNKSASQISKSELRRIVGWMKSIPLTVVARGGGDEFVTAGGVSLQEVNPRTMESLICQGLYFAGEILDIDAFTGGFNLQSSWATGRLAGEHATLPSG